MPESATLESLFSLALNYGLAGKGRTLEETWGSLVPESP